MLNQLSILPQGHESRRGKNYHREDDQESSPEENGALLWFRFEHDSVDLPPTLTSPRKPVVTGL
jgi:hypothetical protein